MAVPDPEPGLVVQFNYLWKRDRDAGSEEARYARPCAIVVAYRSGIDGVLTVMLTAITHSQPRIGDHAIEIPAAVKAHLGMDDRRSWVVVDEVNETGWPGYDLRPRPDGSYVYGFIPPRLHALIKAKILDAYRDGRLRRVSR